MNCPKCGYDIPEGLLYCEKCGEEIHMVPDFDPDLESSLSESVGNLIQELTPKRMTKETEQHRKFPIMLCVTMLILSCLAVTTVVIGVYYHRTTSPDYQVKLANAAVNRNDYTLAIEKLEIAYELDPTQVSLLFDIADYYYLTGNVDDCVITLNEIAFSSYSSEEDVISAYQKIVSVYQGVGDYDSIGEILSLCQNMQVLTQFRDYMTTPPEFSYLEGTYTQVIPLKLIAAGSGTVYYTLDGTEPGENSEIYTAPIFLNPGMTQVRAVYINPYGAASEIVECTYDINVPSPDAPEVNLYSGEFSSPQVIRIEVPEGVSVYYTTDLKEPTMDSIPYTGPIPVPLGQTNYKFIAYSEDGICSEVTMRNYRLTLAGAISPTECVNQLLSALLTYGRIADAQGHAEGVAGRYLYQLACVVHNTSYNTDFYILPEIYEDATGIQTKTGAVYAADAYTGKLYVCEQRDTVNYEMKCDLYEWLELETQNAENDMATDTP